MSSSSIDTVRIVYILYIVGVFVSALMFVGVILAYIERGKITNSLLVVMLTNRFGFFGFG